METKVAQIRAGRLSDAHSLADVYAEAWRGAYRGVIPHISLERMLSRRGLDWWKSAIKGGSLLVLEFGGEPAGYITYGRTRLGRHSYQGEIFELYVHPTYQGLGFGGQLFNGARKKLTQARLKGLIVWALADNEMACDFYRGLGGKPVAEGAERFGDVTLQKIGFAWR